MDNITEKELLELLKSGDFSVHYHNNGSGSIYKGKFNYDDFMDEEGNDIHREEVYEFGDTDGYLPDIVKFLVKALGGKSGSA